MQKKTSGDGKTFTTTTLICGIGVIKCEGAVQTAAGEINA